MKSDNMWRRAESRNQMKVSKYKIQVLRIHRDFGKEVMELFQRTAPRQ